MLLNVSIALFKHKYCIDEEKPSKKHLAKHQKNRIINRRIHINSLFTGFIMAHSKPNKSVMGSENYIWMLRDCLGRGAMGHVYIGRHRRRGDKVAVKQFIRELKTKKDYIGNEIKLIKSIPKNPFIVNLIAIECETHSKDPVLIMELCHGSLMDKLQEPENINGLPENEFSSVMFHIGAALEHLNNQNIAHRDVKPGNILIYISPDDSRIYKLADFGTSKFTENGSFMTMCGTEEYIHPDIHYAAFICKKSGAKFNLSCDIWSFGVVLYQCAAGTMPFEPLTGIRDNKQTMQTLMRNKEPYEISRKETREGTIIGSRNLPNVCQLTSGTKLVVENLLRDIFSFENPVSPKKIFAELNALKKKTKVYMFHPFQSRLFTVYVDRESRMSDAKKMLSEQTGISPQDQIVLHGDRQIQDILVDFPDPKVSEFGMTSEENPFLFASQHEDAAVLKMELPVLPPNDKDVNLSDDANWSKDTFSAIKFLCVVVNLIVQGQTFSKRMLAIYRTTLRAKYTGLSALVDVYQHILGDESSRNGIAVLQKHLTIFIDSKAELEQAVFSRISQCDIRRCMNRARKFEREALESYQHISNNRGKTLHHNDMEIHKYHKSELRRSFRRIKEMLSGCLDEANLFHADSLIIMRKMLYLSNQLTKTKGAIHDKDLTTIIKRLDPSHVLSVFSPNDTSGFVDCDKTEERRSVSNIPLNFQQCTEKSYETFIVNGHETLSRQNGFSSESSHCEPSFIVSYELLPNSSHVGVSNNVGKETRTNNQFSLRILTDNKQFDNNADIFNREVNMSASPSMTGLICNGVNNLLEDTTTLDRSLVGPRDIANYDHFFRTSEVECVGNKLCCMHVKSRGANLEIQIPKSSIQDSTKSLQIYTKLQSLKSNVADSTRALKENNCELRKVIELFHDVVA